MTKKLWSNFGSHKKAINPERRRRPKPKPTNPPARKAVAPPPATVDQAPVPSYRVRDIDIAKIKVDEARRAVNPEKVQTLVNSIRTLGLRQPLTVHVWPLNGGTHLVAGLHRLEAAKILEWKTIPCVEIRGGNTIARLWQIAENLHRAELTALEEAEQIAEWVKLAESLEPKSEEKKKGPGRPEGPKKKAARDLPIKGKTEAAKQKSIDRKLKIAGIDSAAKEAARKAGLDDNPTKLSKIAAEPTPEAQLAKVKDLKSGSRKRSSKAPAKSAPNAKPPFEVMKREWPKAEKLMLAWNRATRADRVRFITEVLKFPLDDE